MTTNIDQIVDDALAQTRVFYPFNPIEVLGVTVYEYQGSPIEFPIKATVPVDVLNSATRIQPPQMGPDVKMYFDLETRRWYWGPDLRQLSDASAVAAAVAKAETEFAATMKDLNAGYSDAERATWGSQLEAATTAGSKSPLLNSMLVPGETASELATKIVEKSKDYQAKLAQALSTLRNARLAAESETVKAKTLLDLLNIAWATTKKAK